MVRVPRAESLVDEIEVAPVEHALEPLGSAGFQRLVRHLVLSMEYYSSSSSGVGHSHAPRLSSA